jgi:NAD(P)-dependent dehydrogenase (short-subunit alcohol dehydrogenase family)
MSLASCHLRLKDKIALITGAAYGIGKATAELFAREGAQVIIADIKDEIGHQVAKEIGSCASYHHLEVSQEPEWVAISQWINKKYKKLDILVNNAGIMGLSHQLGPQDPEHTSLTSWDYIHAINLDSVFLGCKYAIQLMKKGQGGSIINMSSRSGMVGIPNAVAYASSKAAIRNHTKSVALYCAEKNYNIRCNSIHPAAILTPLWDTILGENQHKKTAIANMTQYIPLKRMGEPIDVAYAALYLASDEASFVTGTELVVDGGILAGSAATPEKK